MSNPRFDPMHRAIEKKSKFVQIACCVWAHCKDAERGWGWRRMAGDAVRFDGP